MRGMILNTYAKLARGVNYPGVKYTVAMALADVEKGLNGELISAATLLEDLDEHLLKQVRAKWGDVGVDRFISLGGFDKPSRWQNRIYSQTLQRLFGVARLAELDEFTSSGMFKLADGHGYYVPQIEGRETVALRFYRYSTLRLKR